MICKRCGEDHEMRDALNAAADQVLNESLSPTPTDSENDMDFDPVYVSSKISDVSSVSSSDYKPVFDDPTDSESLRAKLEILIPRGELIDEDGKSYDNDLIWAFIESLIEAEITKRETAARIDELKRADEHLLDTDYHGTYFDDHIQQLEAEKGKL